MPDRSVKIDYIQVKSGGLELWALTMKMALNLLTSKSTVHQQPGPTSYHYIFDPIVGNFEIYWVRQYFINVVQDAGPIYIWWDL